VRTRARVRARGKAWWRRYVSSEASLLLSSKPIPPRLALRCPHEAADALGVSPDFFDEHVRPELRLVRRGRLVFVAVAELERWLESSAARTLEAR
jgi:hypothetical protein